MRISEYLKLRLPEDTDPVKVSDLTENFETLDGALASASQDNEVVGVLTLPSSSGTVTLSLGKPIKRLIFSAYFHATVTITNQSNATGSGSGYAPLGLATSEFESGNVHGSASFTVRNAAGATFSASVGFNANVPKLNGPSVAITYSYVANSVGTSTFSGKIRYCALLDN